MSPEKVFLIIGTYISCMHKLKDHTLHEKIISVNNTRPAAEGNLKN